MEDGPTALGLSGGLRIRHCNEIIHGKRSSFIPTRSLTNHRASFCTAIFASSVFEPGVSVYFRGHKQVEHSAENINAYSTCVVKMFVHLGTSTSWTLGHKDDNCEIYLEVVNFKMSNISVSVLLIMTHNRVTHM
jgi:hypothetical protein